MQIQNYLKTLLPTWARPLEFPQKWLREDYPGTLLGDPKSKAKDTPTFRTTYRTKEGHSTGPWSSPARVWGHPIVPATAGVPRTPSSRASLALQPAGRKQLAQPRSSGPSIPSAFLSGQASAEGYPISYRYCRP